MKHILLPSLLLAISTTFCVAEAIYTNGFETVNKNRIEQFHGVYTVVKDHASEGQYCISQPNRGDRIEARLQPPFIPVESAQTYRLTVKSRNTMPTGLIRFGIVGSSTLDEKGHIWHSPRYKVVPCNSDQWRDYSLDFKTTASCKGLTIVFRIDGSPAKEGTAYWDDIRLEPYTPEIAPISMEKYLGLVTFTDQPTMLAMRPDPAKQATQWQTLDLAKLPVTVNCHQLPESTQVTCAITRMDTVCISESKTMTGDGQLVFTPNLNTLQRGSYQLTVTARANGKTLATCVKSLRRIAAKELEPPPMEPVTSYKKLPDKNAFGINGKYYPIVLMCAYPMRGYANLTRIPDVENYLAIGRRQTGANKLAAYNYGKHPVWPDNLMDCKTKEDIGLYFADDYAKQLDLYWKCGYYCSAGLHIGLGDRVDADLSVPMAAKLKTHPALLYYGYDEPEVHKDSAEAIVEHYKRLKAADPEHAIDINLCQHWRFQEYGPGSDTASFDYYPFHGTGLVEWERYITIMKEKVPNKPLIAYLQAFNFQGEAVPTPEEMETQMRLGIIHGTRMIAIYAWSEPVKSTCLVTDLEAQSAMKGIVAQFYALMDFIMSAEEKPVNAVMGADVRAAAYTRNGETLLVVANISSIQSETFALPDFNGAAAAFEDSAWTIPVQALRKGITLPPNSSHALRLK